GKPPRNYSFNQFPVPIGRAARSGVALHGWKVAKLHAEIQQLGTGFKLIDRGSLAGTWVNSQRIVEYGPLSDTDTVVICGFVLNVQIPLPQFLQADTREVVAKPAPRAAPAPAPTRPKPAAAPMRPANGPSTGTVPATAAPRDTSDADMEQYLK